MKNEFSGLPPATLATLATLVAESQRTARSIPTKTRYMVRKRDPRNVAGWFIRHSTLDLESFQADMGGEFEVRVAKYQDEET